MKGTEWAVDGLMYNEAWSIKTPEDLCRNKMPTPCADYPAENFNLYSKSCQNKLMFKVEVCPKAHNQLSRSAAARNFHICAAANTLYGVSGELEASSPSNIGSNTVVGLHHPFYP